jgi:hypothetical protein
MVIIGADLHKRSHTVVAVDEHGRKLAERTVAATPAGHFTPAGDSKTEAIRALRRRIRDEVFRRMRHDEADHTADRAPLAWAA